MWVRIQYTFACYISVKSVISIIYVVSVCLVNAALGNKMMIGWCLSFNLLIYVNHAHQSIDDNSQHVGIRYLYILF